MNIIEQIGSYELLMGGIIALIALVIFIFWYLMIRPIYWRISRIPVGEVAYVPYHHLIRDEHGDFYTCRTTVVWKEKPKNKNGWDWTCKIRRIDKDRWEIINTVTDFCKDPSFHPSFPGKGWKKVANKIVLKAPA